jgi:hypothetical protein
VTRACLSGFLAWVLAGAAIAATPPAANAPAVSARKSPQLPLTPVGTADELARLTGATARSLASAKAIRGRFVQRRNLAGLSQPLESSGTFLFARGTGIEWHTQQPFDSQFLLTDAGIEQRDEGGVSLRIDTADQPALAVVSRVFFALFALDFTALSHDFELSGARRDSGWVLALKPRAEALGSVFRQAHVSGGASVEQVILEDGNGDSSVIDLTDVQYDPKGLTAEERGRF